MEGCGVKRCKVCRQPFEPRPPRALVCSEDCAGAFAVSKRLKEERRAEKAAQARERKDTSSRKEAIKTLPQLLKEAQAAVNSYVRARDVDLPCISCGKPPPDLSGLHAGRDAGHYRSVGAASHLRFNLDNINAQCVSCNQFKAGNAADYRLGLIERIGLPRVEALEADYSVKKWEKDEVRAIRDEYRAKARELKRETANV